jgi:phosphatidate cytidylyltransferase
VLTAAYLGGPLFAFLVTVGALLAGYEFYRMTRRLGYGPSFAAGLPLIALAVWDAYDPGRGILRWAVPATIMALLVWHILQRDTDGFLVNWALTVAGALYVGMLIGYLVSLRNLPGGLGWLLLAFLGTWTCDTMAYIVGYWWGQRGFFTAISPNKTVEGALGGCVAGLLVSAIVGWYLGLALWQAVLLGALLVTAVTFGDLAESLLKRQVGTKDSGDLIPGHGGMLDRIDSLLFAGPVVYYFLIWLVL